MLHKLQKDFKNFVLSGTIDDSLASSIAKDEFTPKEHLSIYQNNVYHNLTNSLKLTYPTVESLVGEEFFQNTAKVFIKKHPAVSGSLIFYGKEFPEFLKNFEPAQQLPYLPDIAKLDLARYESYHANEDEPLDISKIQENKELTLELRSTIRLLESKYPIDLIYKICTNNSEEKLDITTREAHLIIFRNNYEVEMMLAGKDEYYFLREIKKGAEVDAAAEKTLLKFKDFNAMQVLAKHFEMRTFKAI